jgi:G:T-mismatch repair DNA endonuclease (very short patch repair protein)
MFKCKWCEREFETYNSLGKHTGRTHKIDRVELRKQYFHNGITPLCECGCGEEATFHSSGFLRFKKGHNSKGENNVMFGKTHTIESREAMSQTRKEKFANGATKVWCEGKRIEDTPGLQRAARKISENNERSKKISEILKGRPRTEEHQQNLSIAIKKGWDDPDKKEAVRLRMVDRITSKDWRPISKLEDVFASLLDKEQIIYQRQFYNHKIHAFFDFYLSDHDIYIEVHGDFWHCKPGTKFEIPKYEVQVKNIKNDERKKLWCELNDKKLFIFWESDIMNDPEKIIAELNPHLV